MSIGPSSRPTRGFTALLLGSACAVALTIASVLAASSGVTSRERAEPWLGPVDMNASEAVSPAGSGSLPSAVKPRAGNSEVDVGNRLNWWKVGGPAYRWNEIILDEMQEAFVVLPMAARHLALFHAAIDDAVVNARQHKGASTASANAAAAEAAAAILTHLFPARAAYFASKAEEAVMVHSIAGADTAESIAAGKAYGAKVAAVAIARAKADGSDAKWTGSVPEGPGNWKGANPIAPLAGTWRTWVLTSPSEFRPPAPPAVGSDQVKAALAELKSFARTSKTNHRATYWEVQGGARAHTHWNDIARAKLLEAGKGAEHGARVLAALNIALADAGVACWDAKFTYWYIRPPQLDTELKSLFAAPNHPSYPAAHGCFSTAASTVLAGLFARDRERLLALGKEAAEARVWAGIHYRFDIEAGQEIGRKVGEKVLARAFPPLVR